MDRSVGSPRIRTKKGEKARVIKDLDAVYFELITEGERVYLLLIRGNEATML